ncbi:hypothetical protein [Murimonas intestini]|mgnify:FL=1|uniref:hypothetical protein n=1 Tax=Murimonas intestini TaxID=1337051 RepID=UPI0016526E9E|nr:hypothetical protein [Murimonas intestini]
MKGMFAICFWISYSLKQISFKQAAGFEKISADTYEEMWELVYSYVEKGYLVQ